MKSKYSLPLFFVSILFALFFTNYAHAFIGAPYLSPISNNLNNFYTVSWSSIPGAERYALQEQYNGGDWYTVYYGPNRIRYISNRSDGQYCYRVQSISVTPSYEVSGWSNILCATVASYLPPPDLTVPTEDNDGNYTISWSDIDAPTYALFESLNGTPSHELYRGSNLSKAVSGRSEGLWCYRVQGLNARGGGSLSNVRCTTVLLAPQGAPTLTVPAEDNDGNYTVSWTAVGNATGYTLANKHNGGSWVNIYTGSNLDYAITSSGGGTRCYRVAAQNEVGSSPWSNAACTETPYKTFLPQVTGNNPS